MANFSPGNRAEISSRLLKQIFLKLNCRLHGEGFSPGRNSARPNGPENLKKSHVIETQFQPGLDMRIDFVFQETRWLQLQRRSDFSGIKEIKHSLDMRKVFFQHHWNIFPYHVLPPLVRASIYNPDRPAVSTNSARLEISSLSLQIRLSS